MALACCMSGQCTGVTDKDAFNDHNFSDLKEHCKTINWNNQDDQRIVASLLVKSVYLLEKERLSNTYRILKSLICSRKIYSRGWWEAVGFEKVDDFYEGVFKNCAPSFGAIFKFNPSSHTAASWTGTENAPAYVIVYRGTINLWDIMLDLPVAGDAAHTLKRLSIAKNKVKKFVASDEYRSLRLSKGRTKNPVKVWIAGHSLGATTAISVVMDLIENKELIPMDEFRTFLFNPPFVSIGFLQSNPQTEFGKLQMKWQRKIAELLQKVLPPKGEDARKSLYDWFPDVYVNPGDYISNGFIPYFREGYNNRNVQNLGIYCRTKSGTDVGLPLNLTSGKSLHLLPSAMLHVNDGGKMKSDAEMEISTMENPDRSWCLQCFLAARQLKLQDFVAAHQLKQWWNPTLKLEPAVKYSFKEDTNE